MPPSLAIIHTTPATLDPLRALAQELMPGCRLINLLDDSILPQLGRNGGNLADVQDRWLHYARFAEQAGADLILSACSSVGELVPLARSRAAIPVLRIDEAMAEEAVRRGRRIGVAATLPTTLAPTTRLLQAKAEQKGREIELVPFLIEGAFEKLAAGDKEGHDLMLVAALGELAPRVDVVVLAQASMARVVPQLPAAEQSKFLSSPALAMRRVRDVLASV